jgi:hypothetical protein
MKGRRSDLLEDFAERVGIYGVRCEVVGGGRNNEGCFGVV